MENRDGKNPGAGKPSDDMESIKVALREEREAAGPPTHLTFKKPSSPKDQPCNGVDELAVDNGDNQRGTQSAATYRRVMFSIQLPFCLDPLEGLEVADRKISATETRSGAFHAPGISGRHTLCKRVDNFLPFPLIVFFVIYQFRTFFPTTSP